MQKMAGGESSDHECDHEKEHVHDEPCGKSMTFN